MLNGKKVAYYTLGCKLNFSETSTISRQLEDIGFIKNEKSWHDVKQFEDDIIRKSLNINLKSK